MYSTGLDDSFGGSDHSYGPRITSPYRQNPQPTYQDLEKDHNRIRKINFDLKLRLLTMEEQLQSLDLGDEVTEKLLLMNDLKSENTLMTEENARLQQAINERDRKLSELDRTVREKEVEIVKLSATEEHASGSAQAQLTTLKDTLKEKEEEINRLSTKNKTLQAATNELQSLNKKLSESSEAVRSEGHNTDIMLEETRAKCDHLWKEVQALRGAAHEQKHRSQETEEKLLNDISAECNLRTEVEKHLRKLEDELRLVNSEKVDLRVQVNEERQRCTVLQEEAVLEARYKEELTAKNCDFRWKGTVTKLEDDLQAYVHNTKLLESKVRRKDSLLEEYQVSIAAIELERDCLKERCEEHAEAHEVHINRIHELEDELSVALEERNRLADALEDALAHQPEATHIEDGSKTPTPVIAADAPPKAVSRDVSFRSQGSRKALELFTTNGSMQVAFDDKDPSLREISTVQEGSFREHSASLLREDEDQEEEVDNDLEQSDFDCSDADGRRKTLPVQALLNKDKPMNQYSFPISRTNSNTSLPSLQQRRHTGYMTIDVGPPACESPLARAICKSASMLSPNAAACDRNLSFKNAEDLQQVEIVRVETPRALSPSPESPLARSLSRSNSRLSRQGSQRSKAATPRAVPKANPTQLVGTLASPLLMHRAITPRNLTRLTSKAATPRVTPLNLFPQLEKSCSARSLRLNAESVDRMVSAKSLVSPLKLEKGTSFKRPITTAAATSPYSTPLISHQASPLAVAKTVSSRSMKRVESMRNSSVRRTESMRSLNKAESVKSMLRSPGAQSIRSHSSRSLRSPQDLSSPISLVESVNFDRFEAETVTPRAAKAANEMARTLSPMLASSPPPNAMHRTLSGRQGPEQLHRTLSSRMSPQAKERNLFRTLSGRIDAEQPDPTTNLRTLSGTRPTLTRTLSGRKIQNQLPRTLSGRKLVQPEHRTLSPLATMADPPGPRTLSPLIQPTSPLHATLAHSQIGMELMRTQSASSIKKSPSARSLSPSHIPAASDIVEKLNNEHKILELENRINELEDVNETLASQYETLYEEHSEKCASSEELTTGLVKQTEKYQMACFKVLEMVYVKGVEEEELSHDDTIRALEAAARCVAGVKELISDKMNGLNATIAKIKKNNDVTIAHYVSRLTVLQEVVCKQLASVVQQRNEARKEVTVMQRCIASLEADLDEEHNQKLALEEEKLKLEFDAQKLRTDLELSSQDASKLGDDTTTLRDELNAARERLATTDDRLHTMEEEKAKVEEDFRQRVLKFEELKREFKTLVKQGSAAEAILNGGLEGRVKVLNVTLGTSLESLKEFIEECGWGKQTMGLSEGFLENVRGITSRCGQVVGEIMALAKQAHIVEQRAAKDVSPRRGVSPKRWDSQLSHSHIHHSHIHSDDCVHASIAKHETKTVSVLVDRLESLCETLGHHRQQRESSLKNILHRIVEMEDAITKQLHTVHDLFMAVANPNHSHSSLSAHTTVTRPAYDTEASSISITSPMKSLARKLSLQKPSEMWTIGNVTPIEPEESSPLHRHIESVCNRDRHGARPRYVSPPNKSHTSTPNRTPRFKGTYY